MAPESRGGGGGLSRRAAIALISGGGLLAVSGSGAFDSVEGDRGFDVGTSDNPNEAVLGVTELRDRFAQLLTSTSSEPLLKLINNQSQALVDIEITPYKDDGFGNKTEYQGLTIDSINEIPGASDNNEVLITAEITEPGIEDITLEIFASSTTESESGVSVETSKEIVVAGYETQSCPATPVSTAVAEQYESSGGLEISNERVLGSIQTSGAVDINAQRSGATTLIDGAVTAGAGQSKISANANDSAIYISGDVNVSADGDLRVEGKDIVIGGDVTVEGALDIHANGRGSYIEVCGEADPDTVSVSKNATVIIDGEEQSAEDDTEEEEEEEKPGSGNGNGNGN